MSDETPKVRESVGVGNRGKGRKPGVPNKTTVAVKEAMQHVYASLQDETGQEHGHFLTWAKGEPGEFYKLYAKMLPLDVKADVGGQIVVTWQPAK